MTTQVNPTYLAAVARYTTGRPYLHFIGDRAPSNQEQLDHFREFPIGSLVQGRLALLHHQQQQQSTQAGRGSRF